MTTIRSWECKRCFLQTSADHRPVDCISALRARLGEIGRERDRLVATLQDVKRPLPVEPKMKIDPNWGKSPLDPWKYKTDFVSAPIFRTTVVVGPLYPETEEEFMKRICEGRYLTSDEFIIADGESTKEMLEEPENDPK